MKKIILTGLLGAILMGATSAYAVPFDITAAGQSDTFFFNNSIVWDGKTYVLSANAQLEVLAFSDSSAQLRVTLSNTTELWQNGIFLGPTGGVSVVSFGWDQDPNSTGVTFSDTSDGMISDAAFWDGTKKDNDTNFPSFQRVDLCAWSGNGCSGGPNWSGIFGGQSDTFTVTLAGDFSDGLTINPAYIKYQGSLSSWEFQNKVPEPGTMLLLGTGLLGLGLIRRRNR